MKELVIELLRLLLERLEKDLDTWVPENAKLLSGEATNFCYTLSGTKTIIEVCKNLDETATLSVYSSLGDGNFKEIVSMKGEKTGLTKKLYNEISRKDKGNIEYMEKLIKNLGES